jgi:hypothetical protein
LSPGANRPGPPDLWDRFDAAVGHLRGAMCRPDIMSLGRAFGHLAGVMHEVADQLESDVDISGRQAG